MGTPGVVINRQPQAVEMLPVMSTTEGVLPGLEYLAMVDNLLVVQVMEPLEVMTGFETKNKYRILNNQHQQAYYAFEESESLHRLMCGANRGLIIHITDNLQQEVLTIERPFQCCKGCCWCAEGGCGYPIFVKDRTGNLLGKVEGRNSKCAPHFGVYDADDTLLYDIWGPCCQCQCCCGCTADVNFPIRDVKDDSVVGNVAQIWDGTFRAMFTDAETFGLTFPMGLDVKKKALMLGAVFQIDLMIEAQKQNN